MNKLSRRSAFTLVEVLIVVVIMAILAATIVPQFSDSNRDAKISTAKFNLHTLRAQVELYKSQHDGRAPTGTLVELTSRTNTSGTVGTGPNFPYGPYLQSLPVNPFTNSKVVRTVATDTPAASGETDAGWLYNPTSGKVWMDHADYLSE